MPHDRHGDHVKEMVMPLMTTDLLTDHEHIQTRYVDIIKAADFLSVARLQIERKFSVTKWFDYRFMPPITATLIFQDIYKDLFRKMWRREFDVERALLKRGVPKGGIWSGGREFNSVWGARQVADQLGLPYEFFIGEACEAASRRGARRPPRPNQLYNERNIKVILKKWEERCSYLPIISKLPQYRIEGLHVSSAQADHENWVISNLKVRVATPYAIAKACFEERVIRIERAESEFSSYQMEQVRREGSSMIAAAVEPLTPAAFWPSCFGLPHAPSDSSPICAACHAQAACQRVEPKVRGIIAGRYGSDSPRADALRAQGRERTARHRAKKRAASIKATTS